MNTVVRYSPIKVAFVNLKFGSKGEAVKKIQKIVEVKADGIFGKITQAAVKKYQTMVMLKADGIWGIKTQTRYEAMQSINLYRWKLLPELYLKAKLFLILCEEQNIFVKITQGFRSMAEQAELYAQGRTKPGNIVTNAKPGQSKHNFGKAFDIAFQGMIPYPSEDKLWKQAADIGKTLGLTPGYYFKSFKDSPHFEIK